MTAVCLNCKYNFLKRTVHMLRCTIFLFVVVLGVVMPASFAHAVPSSPNNWKRGCAPHGTWVLDMLNYEPIDTSINTAKPIVFNLNGYQFISKLHFTNSQKSEMAAILEARNNDLTSIGTKAVQQGLHWSSHTFQAALVQVQRTYSAKFIDMLTSAQMAALPQILNKMEAVYWAQLPVEEVSEDIKLSSLQVKRLLQLGRSYKRQWFKFDEAAETGVIPGSNLLRVVTKPTGISAMATTSKPLMNRLAQKRAVFYKALKILTPTQANIVLGWIQQDGFTTQNAWLHKPIP